MESKKKAIPGDLVQRSLAAFIQAGTLDLSLDHLALRVGVSKRMLVHYFGGREALEEQALTLLEDRLHQQFSPAAFPPGISLEKVILALWQQTTAAASRGVLLLVMDVSRRAWSGSPRARKFYKKQQRLWVELLMRYLPDRTAVEEVLQLYQGAVLAYLITGDARPGERALKRIVASR